MPRGSISKVFMNGIPQQFSESVIGWSRTDLIKICSEVASKSPRHLVAMEKAMAKIKMRDERLRSRYHVPQRLRNIERETGYTFVRPFLLEHALLNDKLHNRNGEEEKEGVEDEDEDEEDEKMVLEVDEQHSELNELLEFFGDGVCNTVISLYLNGPNLPFPSQLPQLSGFPKVVINQLREVAVSNDCLARMVIRFKIWDNVDHTLSKGKLDDILLFKNSVDCGKYNVKPPKLLGDLAESYGGAMFADLGSLEVFVQRWLRLMELEKNPLFVLFKKFQPSGVYPVVHKGKGSVSINLKGKTLGSGPTTMEAADMALQN